ncbi:hypothetical protein V2J09_014429 [Rumex salicifolius]
MKRQATLRSSSVREAAASSADTSTVHHVADSVGCMAGVFQLISSKYRTRRKFLTFGRRQVQEKQLKLPSSSPRQSKPNSPARKCRGENRDRFDDYNEKNAGLKEGLREYRRLSCEVPRSPTILPEIRRSNSLNSPESFHSPVPSVVARLMGLEDTPLPPVTVMPSPSPESAVEKRRKLLGALEKCDEDLQELKRIIESVRTTDRPKSPAPPPPLVSFGKGGKMVVMKKCTDPMNGINEEQPSPVSVLEDFCDSPPPPTSSTGGWHSSTKLTQIGRVSPMQLQRKKPREDNVDETVNFRFHNNNNINNNRLHVPHFLLHPKSDWTSTLSSPRSIGDSMEEAVNEVCKDVETGREREIEKLGLVFEDFIYRDLIEEMAKDLLGRRYHMESGMPFEKCKRKLRF